jgi:HEAT repeat protein
MNFLNFSKNGSERKEIEDLVRRLVQDCDMSSERKWDKCLKDREKANNSLIKIGNEAVFPAIQYIARENPNNKDRIFGVIVEIGPGAIDPIFDGLYSENVKIQSLSLWILWRLSEQLDTNSYSQQFKKYVFTSDDSEIGLEKKLDILGVIGDKESINYLIQKINDNNLIIKICAIKNLIKIDDISGLETLFSFAGNKKERALDRARVAKYLCQKMNTDDILPLITDIRESVSDKRDMSLVNEILGEADLEMSRRANDVASLNRMAHDSSLRSETRYAAYAALAEIKTIEAIEVLIDELKRDKARFNYEPGLASQALVKMNDTRTIPYLIQIIENAKIDENDVRAISPGVQWTIETLDELGDSSHIYLLKELKEKIIKRGLKVEYIDTGAYAGYNKTEDTISIIDRAIEHLSKKC